MELNLENCKLFKGLTINEIEDLIAKIEFKEKAYQKGDVIFHEEEQCRKLFILTKGVVHGEMLNSTGKTIKMASMQPCDVLAPAFLFSKQNKCPVTMIASTDASLISISKENVIVLLQNNEKVLKNYIELISDIAQFLSDKIKFLTFQTIKGKFAHYLIKLSEKTKSELISLNKSQQEMAELFGVTRPALAKVIGELDKEGLISAKGKEIRILNLNELKKLLR